MNLYEYFKTNDLISKVGEFKLIQVGVKSGGNSNVLFFKQKNGEKEFAVKFLTEQSLSTRKLKRFVDEYFSLIQLPPHKNVVRQYHLDSFEYPSKAGNKIEISYIIMKKYSSSLKDKAVPDYDGLKILKQIGSGLKHLHNFGVIHRDIKPENIFYDDEIGEYVIGDFGIAHFDEEFVTKLSSTSPTERLANFSFSPEESTIRGYVANPSYDIYSFGQVIHWWYAGQASKGTRTPFVDDSSDPHLKALDKVVHNCIFNNPKQRFQCIDDIFSFFNDILSNKRDVYQRTYDLNNAITKTVPFIKSIETIDTLNRFESFYKNLNEFLIYEEFWWVDLNGGDLDFKGLVKIDNNKFLFSKFYEIEVEKIIFYKHDSRLYNNFFIVLTKPSEMFDIYDRDGNIKPRKNSNYYKDIAILFDGKYYDPSLFQNKYFELPDGQVIDLTDHIFEERHRFLKPFAFLVCPKLAGPACGGNDIAAELLRTVRQNDELTEDDMNLYLRKIRKYHSSEFTMWD
ncbi:protein kinase domain-containing protein [Acinetobacter sp. 22301]|uniref:protein kinase domain-containing protein n=1 Tax=Acinetobacter sp. 22301 TaxID=3453904 RepID=UPI003F854452